MEVISSVTIVTAVSFEMRGAAKIEGRKVKFAELNPGGSQSDGKGTNPVGICVTINIDLDKAHSQKVSQKSREPLIHELGIELDDVKVAIIAAAKSYLDLSGKLTGSAKV